MLRVQENNESTSMRKGKLNTHRQAFNKYNMDIDKKLKGVTNDHTLTRTIGYLIR